jgi:hypothetical protein
VDQVRVVSVKNQRGDRHGKLRPIVNPHDVAGPHTFDQATEYSTYHPAMKEPGQVFKVPTEVFIDHHGRQNVDRLLGEAPGSISVWADDYRVGCVSEYIPGPARDRASRKLRKCLSFGKKMVSGSGHRTPNRLAHPLRNAAGIVQMATKATIGCKTTPLHRLLKNSVLYQGTTLVGP